MKRMEHRQHRKRSLITTLAAVTLIAAACGDDEPSEEGAVSEDTTEGSSDGSPPVDTDEAPPGSGSPADCETVDEVSLQLQWVAQAQFGGYFAAADQGYYADRCLDVTLVENPPDVVPQQQLADGQVDFAIAWVPKALRTREEGANIVNIAQMFQRSGTLQVSFKEQGIETPEDFAGKNIGNWGFGNEYEVFAAMALVGLDPATDVNLVGQDFNMLGLLSGDIDAAEAMTYNEWAQVLETIDPDSGELYSPDDFNVISYDLEGVGMLQDAVWADGERLASDEAYEDIAVRFLAASFEGWGYCREEPEACRDIVVGAGSQLGNSHQLWQMNEVNQLMWPAPDGIGYMVAAKYETTVDIALNTPGREGVYVLEQDPDADAYTTEYTEAAWELLADDFDIYGEDYEPIEVTLEEGGS